MKVFGSLIVVAMALVNVIGADAVGKLQSIIVVVLLVVFAFFIVVTLEAMPTSACWRPSTYPSVTDIVVGGGAHVLRLPRLRGHRQHRRVDPEPGAQRAARRRTSRSRSPVGCTS